MTRRDLGRARDAHSEHEGEAQRSVDEFLGRAMGYEPPTLGLNMSDQPYEPVPRDRLRDVSCMSSGLSAGLARRGRRTGPGVGGIVLSDQRRAVVRLA